MLRFRKKEASKSSKKDRIFTVLDIGSHTIKALVCELGEREVHVLGVGKAPQALGEMEQGTIVDIAGVIERCHQAMLEAGRMAGQKGQALILGVAGELVKGETSMITYKRRDSTEKIDPEELKNIIHKIQWKAFEKVRSELAYEAGINEIDVKLVHAAIVDTRIDGYKVGNPVGFQGKEIQMSIFNAFAPLIHYGALQTICAELDRELLAIMDESYAVGRLMGGSEPQGYSGIFLDIGGASTDLSITVDGSVIGTRMFNLGGRAFTKRLAQALNVSYTEAEEVKLAYAKNQLEQQSQQIVQQSLTSDIEIWLTGVFLTLQEMGALLETLPPTIYLCGGGAELPLLKAGLEKPDWSKGLSFPRKPEVRILLPKHISHIKDHTKQLDSPGDIPPMALANIGMELLLEEKVLTKMLKKVVRLMQV